MNSQTLIADLKQGRSRYNEIKAAMVARKGDRYTRILDNCATSSKALAALRRLPGMDPIIKLLVQELASSVHYDLLETSAAAALPHLSFKSMDDGKHPDLLMFLSDLESLTQAYTYTEGLVARNLKD